MRVRDNREHSSWNVLCCWMWEELPKQGIWRFLSILIFLRIPLLLLSCSICCNNQYLHKPSVKFSPSCWCLTPRLQMGSEGVVGFMEQKWVNGCWKYSELEKSLWRALCSLRFSHRPWAELCRRQKPVLQPISPSWVIPGAVRPCPVKKCLSYELTEIKFTPYNQKKVDSWAWNLTHFTCYKMVSAELVTFCVTGK